MNNRSSSLASWLLRLLLTAAIGYYLYRTIDWAEFAHLVGEGEPLWLAAAVGAYLLTTALGITRWQILLRASGLVLPLSHTIQLTFIGLFANNFMLSSMGGDLLKAFYASREFPQHKPRVIMSILMERILGFLAMFLVSTALIISRFGALTHEPVTRIAVYLYFAVLVLLCSLVWLGTRPFATRLLPFLNQPRWHENIEEATAAYRFFLTHPLCFGGGMLLSALAHFSLMSCFFFVSEALHMQLHFWDLAAVLPLIFVVTLLPTINGFGVREVAFQHFLVFAGQTQEPSVALSLGGACLIMACSLPGGLLLLRYRPPSPASPPPSTTTFN